MRKQLNQPVLRPLLVHATGTPTGRASGIASRERGATIALMGEAHDMYGQDESSESLCGNCWREATTGTRPGHGRRPLVELTICRKCISVTGLNSQNTAWIGESRRVRLHTTGLPTGQQYLRPQQFSRTAYRASLSGRRLANSPCTSMA